MVYALLIIFLTFFNFKNRLTKGLMLTAVSGMYLSFGLLLSTGYLFYLIGGLKQDKTDFLMVIRNAEQIYPYLSIGYLLVSRIDYFSLRKKQKKASLIEIVSSLKKNININLFCFFFLLLSFTGSILTSFEFASSGIGTLFPLLGNFIYPICILVVFNLKKNNFLSMLNIILLILTVGINAFSSGWRSQLIFVGFSFFLGLNLKGLLNYYLVAFISFLFLYFIVPFQYMKKFEYEKYNNDTSLTFQASLEKTVPERIEYVSDLFAFRLNYMREIAFVQNAMEKQKLSYREGQTYVEVVLQLIPRVLWPTKPSYNRFTGFEVPRKIGLLSESDLGTSWGVNSFAEFIYNFSFRLLPIFVLLLYFMLNYLDNLAATLKLKPHYSWLLQTTLFFLALNLVSVIFFSTYFLWTFIIIILFNRLFG